MDEWDEMKALWETPLDEWAGPTPAGPARQWAPILAGIAVSLVYVAAIAAVVVGLLRLTRDHVQRLSAQRASPGSLLARLPIRR